MHLPIINYIPWMSKTVFGTVLREGLFLGTNDERLFSETYMLGYVLDRKCFPPQLHQVDGW